ncbi:hypothetical protein AGMMS50268_26140 [Spirochaetia bacterium]|nr:hypothetical protein AGMMS50268_26140 [Spirochaetia bacterium]
MKKISVLLVFITVSITNVLFSQTAEVINAAIGSGDCGMLYVYIQKGKDETDPKLVSSATAALRRYTSIDGGTLKYRTGKMDARVRGVGKELMDKVFTDPLAALPGVTAKLVTGVGDQFLKVKVIHDWICDNIAYDAEMYFSGRVRSQDYVSVLKKKAGVCSGYVSVFNAMCALAGIESIGISGYSKGFGYRETIGRQTDHEWNAVKLGGKWYLLDVTWDAGHLDRRTYIKNYSTEWLFLDSRPFLYSHLPEQERYQFYAPAITAADFIREAYIAGKFFHYGLSLKTEDPGYNNLADNGFSFDIALRNAGVSLSSELRTTEQDNVNSASWEERKGSVVAFDFDVPDASEYKGHIFARLPNEVRLQEKIDVRTFEGNWIPGTEQLFTEKKITEKELSFFKEAYFKVADNNAYYFAEDQLNTARNNAILKIHKLLELETNWMDNVLDINIKAAPGYQGFGKGVQKYPFTFSTYNDVSDTQLVSPIKGVLKAGSTETFVFSSKNYGSIAIILDGKFNFFTKNSKTGNFELAFEIPSGIETLKISGGKDQRSTHWGLIQYDIEQ